jgi:hypothetical protein
MHGPDALREEVVMEAYLRRREECGVRGMLTKGSRQLTGPLSMARWGMSAEQCERAGPRLWEESTGSWEGACVCAFSRTLAASGIATWADVARDDGSVVEWKECKRRWGLKESARGKEDWYRVVETLGRSSAEVRQRWKTACDQRRRDGGGRDEAEERTREEKEWGGGEWAVKEVLAARKAPTCMGGWEYRVRWEGDYADTWEAAKQMGGTVAMKREMLRAREEREVCVTFEEWLEREAEQTGARRRRAWRALARIADTREEAGEGEWDEAWELFTVYAEEARRWDDGGRNVGSNARAGRGAAHGRATWSARR